MVSTTFAPSWFGIDGIFGGYVLAAIVEAADRVEGFSPQSVTMDFAAAVQPGEVQIVASTLHAGRRTAMVRVELGQDKRVRAQAIGSLVPSGQEVTWVRRRDPSSWGDPETSPPLVAAHRELAYGGHLDIREVGSSTLEHGAAAWVRMTATPDQHGHLGPHAQVALLLDVLAPGVFALHPPPAFVPTVEFTVHFSPLVGGADWHMAEGESSAWYLITNRTVWATDQVCVDESRLYDRQGRVAAQVRQGRSIRWS